MSVVIELLKPSNAVCLGEKPDSVKYLWSDNKDHVDINFSDLRLFYKKCRFWRRTADKFNNLPYSICPDGFAKGNIILAFDYVQYAQGWYFKKKYFKRKDWYNVCNTKRGMIDFFNRYVDQSDKDAREMINRFIDSWEDGMLFVCSW